MVCAEAERQVVMDCAWSRPALMLFAVLSCSCARSDPLSAVPNSAGTAVLEDQLIGADRRAICVTATAREACSWRQSEIYVEGVKSLSDVRARWVNDNLVVVDVASGTIRRFVDRSRNGRIAIRLTRNVPTSGITIYRPGGNETIPWSGP